MSWFSKWFGLSGSPSSVQSQSKRQIHAIIKEELEKARKEIIDNMRVNHRNASGRSVAGLKVVVKGDEGYIDAPLSFTWMERGRRPGGSRKGIRDIIMQWMIDKGIAPRNDGRGKKRSLKSAANAIAHTIATQGTRLHRYGGYQNIYTAAARGANRRIAKRVFDYTDKQVEEIFRILD